MSVDPDGATPRRALLGDAARLVAAAVALWLALSALGYLLTHGPGHRGLTTREGAADRFFAAHRSALWNRATEFASLLGDTLVVVAVAAVAFVVLAMTTRRWRASVFVLVAMLGEVAIFTSTTVVVDRVRPAVQRLDRAPPTSSFPSGHTAAASTLYGGLAVIAVIYLANVLMRNVTIAVALALVASVATSRLYRGMHYPSDVLGGLVLGSVWLTVVAVVVLRGRGTSGPASEHTRHG